MIKQTFTLPNCITMLRIVGAISLVFVEPFSVLFFVIYSLSGVSDIFDGWLARRTNAVSELGSKLDSVADLLFYGAMLIKLLPALIDWLPHLIWYFVAAIIAVRVASYCFVAIKHHRFSSMHTYADKLSGLFVFCVPYFVVLIEPVIYCSAVCVVTAFASLEELGIHLFVADYRDDIKTIFRVHRADRDGTTQV